MDEELKTRPTGRGRRFSTMHLFYTVTLIASALSLGTGMLIPATVVLFIWMAVFLAKEPASLFLFAVFAFLISAPCLLGPGGGLVTPPASRLSAYNIRSISDAIFDYVAVYGHLPPASDLEDEYRHSWRVEILPQLGYQSLYDRYRFDEPWDSKANLELLEEMPDAYACTALERSGVTNFKLVTGPETAFDGGPADLFEIKDGLSRSLMIVEDYRKPVPWTSPEDLSVTDAVDLLSHTDPVAQGHCRRSWLREYFRGASLALFNGQVESSVAEADPEAIRQLCLIDDGFPDEPPQFDHYSLVRINKRIAVSATSFAIIAVLPAFFIPPRQRRIC